MPGKFTNVCVDMCTEKNTERHRRERFKAENYCHTQKL